MKPIVHQNYDGRDLVLPDDPSYVLREADDPELAAQHGHDIITASGLTLLGADDKAGVAEIMAAAEHLMAHPEIPHGAVKIGFTPDEEVGRGTDYFDVARFGANYAYTLDGGTRGRLETENFSADAITLTFRGFNFHPGYAKGKMVSALKLAAEFVHRLPGTACRRKPPRTTKATCTRTRSRARWKTSTVKLLLRDFTDSGLAGQGASRHETGRGGGAAVSARRRLKWRSRSSIGT